MKQLRLLVELFLQRHGWLPVFSVLLALAGGWLHFVGRPELAADSVQERRVLALLKEGMANREPQIPLVEQRYRDFRSHLAPRRGLPDVIKTFFAAARKNGLVLQKMDYSLVRPAAGDYLVYRINAPLTGPYAAVRRFAQDILEKVPAAALEEAAFKRSAVGVATTEAKLRFALYLREDE